MKMQVYQDLDDGKKADTRHDQWTRVPLHGAHGAEF